MLIQTFDKMSSCLRLILFIQLFRLNYKVKLFCFKNNFTCKGSDQVQIDLDQVQLLNLHVYVLDIYVKGIICFNKINHLMLLRKLSYKIHNYSKI